MALKRRYAARSFVLAVLVLGCAGAFAAVSGQHSRALIANHPQADEISVLSWLSAGAKNSVAISRLLRNVPEFGRQPQGVQSRADELLQSLLHRPFADSDGNGSLIQLKRDPLSNPMVSYGAGNPFYVRPVYVEPPTGPTQLLLFDVPPETKEPGLPSSYRALKALWLRGRDRVSLQDVYVTSTSIVLGKRVDLLHTPLVSVRSVDDERIKTDTVAHGAPNLSFRPLSWENAAKVIFPQLSWLPNVSVLRGNTPAEKRTLGFSSKFIDDIIQNPPRLVASYGNGYATAMVGPNPSRSKTPNAEPANPYLPTWPGPIESPSPTPAANFGGEYPVSGFSRGYPQTASDYIAVRPLFSGKNFRALCLSIGSISSALLLGIRSHDGKNAQFFLIPYEGPKTAQSYASGRLPWVASGINRWSDLTTTLLPYVRTLRKWKKDSVAFDQLPHHAEIAALLTKEGLAKDGHIPKTLFVYAPETMPNLRTDAFSATDGAPAGAPANLNAALSELASHEILGKRPVFTKIPLDVLGKIFPEIAAHEVAHLLDTLSPLDSSVETGILTSRFDKEFPKLVAMKRASFSYQKHFEDYLRRIPPFMLQMSPLSPAEKDRQLRKMFENYRYGPNFSRVRNRWQKGYVYRQTPTEELGWGVQVAYLRDIEHKTREQVLRHLWSQSYAGEVNWEPWTQQFLEDLYRMTPKQLLTKVRSDVATLKKLQPSYPTWQKWGRR